MKKFLGVVALGLLLCANAFALSGDRKNIEYQTCYKNTLNDGSSNKFAKTYCNCFAKKIDGKYTDKQLDDLVNKGMEYMINEIKPLAKKCYDKLS